MIKLHIWEARLKDFFKNKIQGYYPSVTNTIMTYPESEEDFGVEVS